MKTWIYGLIILGSLISGGAAHCQPPQKINSNYQFKSVGADSGGVRIPKYQVLPTNPTANYIDSGALAYQVLDSNVYYWNGRIWINVSTGNAFTSFQIQAFIGGIYNKGSFSSTSDFAVVGLTATPTAGKIVTSGGNGTFARRIDLKTDTCTYERWKASVIVQPSARTGSSFGPAIGLHSLNTASPSQLFVQLGGTSSDGHVYIQSGGSTPSQAAVSSTTLSFSANDSILLTAEINVDTVTGTAYNYTNQSFVSVRFIFQNSYPQSFILPNTGVFSFVNLNSDATTLSVDSMSVSSKDLRNNNLLVVGDSKQRAYYAGLFTNRYLYKLGLDIQGVAISAGPGDRSTEMLEHLSNDISRKPKYVLLNAPSNDVRFSVPAATSDSNFVQLYNAFTAAGSTVVIGLPMFETSIDLTPQVTFIYNRFPGVPKIDYWSAMKYNPSFLLAPDGIHPNASGNDTLYKVSLNSWKLYGGQFQPLLTVSNPISGTTNQITKFTSSTAIGNSTASDDGTTYTIPEATTIGCAACVTKFVPTMKGSTDINFRYFSFQNEMVMAAETDDRSKTDSAAIFGGPLYLGYGLYNGGSPYKSTKLMRLDSTGVVIQDQAWTGTSNVGFVGGPPSSIFTINGTATTPKGMLPPRMTTTQRLAIASPAEGLMVYDLTLHQMAYFNGTIWTIF